MAPLLLPFGDDLWTVAVPHTMVGLHLGARMTVVRLPNGGLLVHSPIPLTRHLRPELDALGAVEHIVLPNLYHHVYAAEMLAAYPKAIVHAPAGLSKKRPDLRIHRTLSERPHDDWGGALTPIPIAGCALEETVFLHPRSRTLISADLSENFTSCDHLATRLYLIAAGVYKKPGWSRFLRVLYRDHAAARDSIDRVLEQDFAHLILSHGDPIRDDAKQAVEATFTWLSNR